MRNLLAASLLYFLMISCVRQEIVEISDDPTGMISPLSQDLDTLLSWFPGEYDNHEQVYSEFTKDIPAEKRHRQTHHIFHPVEFSFISGRQLYAEQSQHYDREDIYRQRIYSFEVDEEEKAIRLTIYTPKVPSKLTDLHLATSKVSDFVLDDFVLKPGCEVYWKKKGDEFHGYLKDNACSYYSEKFKKRVYLNETLILSKEALLLDDAAVDESGAPVFGVHDKGPTINKKEKNCN